ncbi:hypothetical protein N7510_009510 [Penicillium lagena]|uniref:uncharacterized protein n=1 Tax=Penicillium lagena TaxID=94218 RepID=UPI00253FF5A2|nr:uncharacterized protein N7510_009510 [Penicillium lagena]KAJ5604356.1 hypothetical protein N7510_009510 [Penicillium lagena]
MPNPTEEDISNWLIENPQRLNLANIGLFFGGDNVTENQLVEKSQDLDLWAGTIQSTFRYKGSEVSVEVWCHPTLPTVGIQIKSDLLESRDLGVFFDFPYSDTNKFDAPYVGVWNDTSHNIVKLRSTAGMASFEHIIDSNSNEIMAKWNTEASVSGPLPGSNKFVLSSSGSDTLQLVVAFDTANSQYKLPSYDNIVAASKEWWADYWVSGAFIDLSATENANATELQRRIILSQYLVAVNEASHNPPQGSCQVPLVSGPLDVNFILKSQVLGPHSCAAYILAVPLTELHIGLVNNGWYGKFHVSFVHVGHKERLGSDPSSARESWTFN